MSPRPRPSAVALAARRLLPPKYDKPVGTHCDTCPMRAAGRGYVPATGPPTGRIVLVGEGPGYDEAIHGEAFVGAAGSMLVRILRVLGRHREQYPIQNVVRCVPPDFDLEKFPGAVEHCRYLDDDLARYPADTVLVALGAVPMRKLLSLHKHKDVRIQDFHGTVTRVGPHWVVPTFHPSHLQRGATNLFGVVVSDLTRAHDVASRGWPADPGVLVTDPPVDWFAAWADAYIAAATQDPYAYPLAVDTEYPEKESDEGALVGQDLSGLTVDYVNLSCHPDEGVSVPFEPGYIEILQRIFAARGVQYYWHKGADVGRLLGNGMPVDVTRAWDCMWAAKALQSDLPMGLGFWAPLYSTWGAWKHLRTIEPARYRTIDGLQTRRVGDGILGELAASGRWDVFARHMHDFHRIVLQPATEVGLAVDRSRLLAFKAKLDAEASRLLDAIAVEVPAELCPRTPPAGLTRPPAPEIGYTKARATKADGTPKKDAPDPLKLALYARAYVVESLVIREVGVCATCGAREVTKTHRCADRTLTAAVRKQPMSVTRWFWQEPFNPDSPAQLLAYAKAKGHTVGKAKTTGHDSMDRETLGRLVRETSDPLYQHVLAYRAVAKVRGTYVIGTEKRLDADDRLHGTFGFKPSTMRLNGANPNLQNVVADKGGTESLAAGFRSCVVARGRMVPDDSEYADA